MAKFNIGITVLAPISTVVEVEAADEAEAEEKARTIVLTDEAHRVKDFNGNTVEILDDDLIVDSINAGDTTL